MGLIDSLFIIDDKDDLIFEHVVNSSSPSFDYVHDQLIQAQRRVARAKGVEYKTLEASNRGLFDEHSCFLLDPIVVVDSSWTIAWNKVGNLCILALAEVEPNYMEVYSEDEDEEDEDETGANEGETQPLTETVEPTEVKPSSSAAPDLIDTSPLEVPQGKLPGESSTIKNSSPAPKATVPYPINPLQYTKFFQDFVQVSKAFLETDKLTPLVIRSQSHKLVLVLQEMLDASYPYITDLNQLRELVPTNSILKKITKTARQLQQTATTSISNINQQHQAFGAPQPSLSTVKTSSIFEKSGNEIPWRQVGLKSTDNELFVDVIESTDFIVPTSKGFSQGFNSTSAYYDVGVTKFNKPAQPVVARITGKILVKSSLPGMPKVQLILDGGSHDLGVPSFHRCVDLQTYLSNRSVLEFVPPDETFTLMEYGIDLLEETAAKSTNYWNYTGIVDAEMITGLGVKRNEFEIRLQTKLSHSADSVDHLHVDIFLPRGKDYVVKPLRITRGNLESRGDGLYEWSFDKQTATGQTLSLKAEIVSDEERDQLLKPSFAKVNYKCRGSLPSGNSVKALHIVSGLATKAKPYKGVRYTTYSGDYVLR